MSLRHGLATAILATLICMLGRYAFMILGASGNFNLVAVIWWFWTGLTTLFLGVGFVVVITLGTLGIDIMSAWLKDFSASGAAVTPVPN